MSVVTDLQEARELILKEEHWTTEVLARNASGLQVRPWEPEACQWCAMGAVEKVCFVDRLRAVYPSPEAVRFQSAWTVLCLVAPDTDPTTLNDEQGHSATIELFDKAITLAKEQA